MPQKPSQEAVLSFYSHNEILELAKQKAEMDIQERLGGATAHLDALSGLFSSSGSTPALKSSSKKGRRGRAKASSTKKTVAKKKTSSKKTAKKSKAKKAVTNKSAVKKGTTKTKIKVSQKASRKTQTKITRTKSKKPLNTMLTEIIGSKPIKTPDIARVLKKKGWKSDSKNPSAVLNLQLMNMVKKGLIKRKERGIYVKG